MAHFHVFITHSGEMTGNEGKEDVITAWIPLLGFLSFRQTKHMEDETFELGNLE